MSIAPDHPVLPTQSVTATVVLEEQLDDVTGAWVEIGYVNTYCYMWAPGGSGPGGYKDASDWVHALETPLVLAGGILPAGSHSATLRLPSWAPGSGSAIQWQARLRVERKGKAPEPMASFVVRAPAPDPLPTELRLVQGEFAITTTVDFDLVTDAPAYRAGSPVRGTISVTPTEHVTRSASANVRLMRAQVSHPLKRNPAPRTESFIRPHVTVADDLALVQGVTTEIPFEIMLPADADPTTEAVHNTLEWWLVATVAYAGLTGGIEKARREIVVHTGP